MLEPAYLSRLHSYGLLIYLLLNYSLAGPIHDLVKRASDKAAAEYSSLELKGRSMEERLAFSSKQTEAAQRDAQDWKKRYENIMNDYNRASENSAAQYSTLQKKVTSLEERRTVLGTQLEGAKKEAADWQSKFESFFAARRAEEERLNSEIASLQVFYN
jgi:chromosome segregation ATPase